MNKPELINHISANSRYVENALRHGFLSELFRSFWQHDPSLLLQVYTGEIDSFGHDIVLVLGRVTRHIQLKSSRIDASSRHTTLNCALSQTPSGCAVWMFYDSADLRIIEYGFFGSPPDEPPPNLADDYRIAKHNKANSKGNRADRPNIRKIPRSKFVRVASQVELIRLLFGIAMQSAKTHRH